MRCAPTQPLHGRRDRETRAERGKPAPSPWRPVGKGSLPLPDPWQVGSDNHRLRPKHLSPRGLLGRMVTATGVEDLADRVGRKGPEARGMTGTVSGQCRVVSHAVMRHEAIRRVKFYLPNGLRGLRCGGTRVRYGAARPGHRHETGVSVAIGFIPPNQTGAGWGYLTSPRSRTSPDRTVKVRLPTR
jgi:hypothetical protein